MVTAMSRIRERDLYPPIKAFLERQGYEVKSELADADVVACRLGEAPVIVELKAGFSLALFHQAVVRLAVSDLVYVAVPRGAGRRFARALAENRALCRRLGLGLLTVRLPDGLVEAHLDPGPCQPRKSARRQQRLLREFARRVGDPNTGGVNGVKIVTAYRQDALRCAAHLAEHGPTKGAHVAGATGVARATRIMAADHYGWFQRVTTGIYTLTPRGRAALVTYCDALSGG